MDFLPRVAIQGEEGSFSQEAGIKYWGNSVVIIPKRTADEVIRSVEQDEADYGLLPIENSLIGSISTTYDALLESQLQITGEVITPISHCLLALQKVQVSEIERIYSHPAALSQCSSFLENLHDCEIVPIYDTAGSAMKISKERDKKSAAIASRLAAKLYSLEIVAERLEDYPNNQTRFIIIAKSGEPFSGQASKTSIVFTTLHQPGALYKVLKVFKYLVVLQRLWSNLLSKTS